MFFWTEFGNEWTVQSSCSSHHPSRKAPLTWLKWLICSCYDWWQHGSAVDKHYIKKTNNNCINLASQQWQWSGCNAQYWNLWIGHLCWLKSLCRFQYFTYFVWLCSSKCWDLALNTAAGMRSTLNNLHKGPNVHGKSWLKCIPSSQAHDLSWKWHKSLCFQLRSEISRNF